MVVEGAQAPLSTSMPVHVKQSNYPTADSTSDNQPYQLLLPGISHASLYPTLSALSAEMPSPSGTSLSYYEQVINEIDEQERIVLAVAREAWHISKITKPVDTDNEPKDLPKDGVLNDKKILSASPVDDAPILESLVEDTSNNPDDISQQPELDGLNAPTVPEEPDRILDSVSQQEISSPTNIEEEEKEEAKESSRKEEEQTVQADDDPDSSCTS